MQNSQWEFALSYASVVLSLAQYNCIHRVVYIQNRSNVSEKKMVIWGDLTLQEQWSCGSWWLSSWEVRYWTKSFCAFFRYSCEWKNHQRKKKTWDMDAARHSSCLVLLRSLPVLIFQSIEKSSSWWILFLAICNHRFWWEAGAIGRVYVCLLVLIAFPITTETVLWPVFLMNFVITCLIHSIFVMACPDHSKSIDLFLWEENYRFVITCTSHILCSFFLKKKVYFTFLSFHKGLNFIHKL